MDSAKTSVCDWRRRLAACTLASLLALTPGCYGPFKTHTALYKWNVGLEGKWTIETVFAGLYLTGVYPIVGLVDILVLNSIEFWSTDTPSVGTTEGSGQPADRRDAAVAALVSHGPSYSSSP